ncbi:hypothetical protein EJ04DRAFT_363755 [Polyplosphaeria fusca]|uniref:Uncharacterized protein n=1 Tax=Polyplosphaeria fusca TaxID=682080 RepID=A0A9P4QS32_9PLEO|nr:hypothetical protein EJ04DRAFT_363755 [Polyplosphaeria fusca]
MHCFASPLPPGQQTARSLRASQYRAKRKRKRDGDIDGDGDIDNDNTIDHDHETNSAAVPPDSAQVRVAGLLPGAAFDMPAPPFPHAPARTPRTISSGHRLQKSLAGLDPPLFAVTAASKSSPLDRPSKRPALRETHLAVLTAVLHRSLLHADYQRAGRAWGLLLRTQIAGVHVDPRNHARWGIGAELLLRHRPHEELDQTQFPNHHAPLYSNDGFALARKYYDRLIIQHPYRKQVPNAVDALTFYPAMFSLWIYEAGESTKRALLHLDEGLATSSEPPSTIDSDTISPSTNARVRASAIKAEELHCARQIADRLDELVTSPPFDKHPSMLQLRGYVGIWISDLIVWDYSIQHHSWLDSAHGEYTRHSTLNVDQLDAYARSRAALTQALGFLRRARANGGQLEEHIAGVEAKSNALKKKIAQRLNG